MQEATSCVGVEQLVDLERQMHRVIDRLQADVPKESKSRGNVPTKLTLFFLLADGMSQREIANTFSCSRRLVVARTAEIRAIWRSIELGV